LLDPGFGLQFIISQNGRTIRGTVSKKMTVSQKRTVS